MEDIKPTARLGIDFGRVIMGAADADGRADTSFLSGGEARAMETSAEPGSFETIRSLCIHLDRKVWIVSKCGARIERRTRRWLDHHSFFDRTGVPRENLRFCRERREKKIHCRDLGITHFIDDRMDVLTHLRGLVPNLYWFGAETLKKPAPKWVTPVADWSAVRSALLGRKADELGLNVVSKPDSVGRPIEAVSRDHHRS
ncbi:MAG: hypothetical protein AAF517_19750 [Planctomycetota bacterium]